MWHETSVAAPWSAGSARGSRRVQRGGGLATSSILVQGSRVARPTPTVRRLALLCAALAGVVLCAPRLELGYFWDDYIFLTAAHADPATFLLPNATTIFYRPISMGLTFLLLDRMGPWGSIGGHVLNLALAVAAILLVGSLARRVAGFRAGLVAAFAYAGLFAVPSLVAWTTASQDLLAIVFMLLALNARDAGKLLPAMLAAACALYSKETALALLPALILWPWPLRRPDRLVPAAVLGVVLVAIWGATHPAGHALLAGGFRSETTGYVHVQDSSLWLSHLASYVLALAHVPWFGVATEWPQELVGNVAVAVTLVIAGVWLGRSATPRPDRGIVAWRAAVLSSLLIFPPLVMNVVLVGHWTPYYLGLPGVGFAVLLGMLLWSAPLWLAAGVLALYFVGGVWLRGIHSDATVRFTERDMVEASNAHRMVEEGFLRARPTLESGAQVYLSIAGTGRLGMTQTLLQGQALRVWYGDHTIQTRTPWELEDDAKPAHLFYVGSTLEVVEIDLRTLEPRGGVPLRDFQQYTGAIRSYAFGLARSGHADVAAQILLSLPAPSPLIRSYNERLAATALLSADRESEAAALLDRSAPIDSSVASAMAAELLLEPKRSYRDADVLRAFQIHGDPDTVYRRYSAWFRQHGYEEQAAAFESKLEAARSSRDR